MGVRLAAAALAVCVAALPAQAQGGFRRGIGLAQVMGWAERDAAGHYVFPPFADASRRLDAGALAALRRSGFDFVRLAVDPGPFLAARGAQREAVENILRTRVEALRAAGLCVIVDFHPAEENPDYAPRTFADGVRTASFAAFLELLARTGALLEALPQSCVALELLNEPVAVAATWQPMLEAAYRAARSRAPNLPLVVSGAEEGQPDGLLALRTQAFRPDSAVFYSVHYYDPYQFTHQGASWNAARHLGDVPYPAAARPLAESLAASAAAIEAAPLNEAQKRAALADARRRLEAYRRSDFGRASIARAFERIAQWARANDIPPQRILLGEFGARGGPGTITAARPAERARWLRDVREEAEARGFAWAVWVYRDSGGFSLARPDGRLDPEAAAALGLAPAR